MKFWHLFSNRVLAPFLSRIDGENQWSCFGAQGVLMEEERDEHLLFFIGLNRWERRESRCGG
jgi:hypothetical protein